MKNDPESNANQLLNDSFNGNHSFILDKNITLYAPYIEGKIFLGYKFTLTIKDKIEDKTDYIVITDPYYLKQNRDVCLTLNLADLIKFNSIGSVHCRKRVNIFAVYGNFNKSLALCIHII